jgi:hypothetical protein
MGFQRYFVRAFQLALHNFLRVGLLGVEEERVFVLEVVQHFYGRAFEGVLHFVVYQHLV